MKLSEGYREIPVPHLHKLMLQDEWMTLSSFHEVSRAIGPKGQMGEAGLRGMRYAPNVRRAQGTKKGDRKCGRLPLFGQRELEFSKCVSSRLVWIGEIACRSTASWMKRAVEKVLRSHVALRDRNVIPPGSAAVNRAGHEVIVAHARKVRLIGDSSRKDNRIHAQTLAQLGKNRSPAVGPVRHGGAKAQIHLTVIRTRAGLASARNDPGEYGARAGEDVWRTAAQELAYSRCANETYSPCKFVVSRA